MDMEELTKTQLILLALLVSFVTSIATGIATASLLEQAPPEVMRVVDRVVERTVETVTPANATNAVTTTEKTVVVREDDLITESVAKVSESLVRVLVEGEEGAEVGGIGFFVSKEGHVLTAASLVENKKQYSLRLADGSTVIAAVVAEQDSRGWALLETVGANNRAFTPVTLGEPESVRLGQSIIVVSGAQNSVSTGIVSSVNYAGDGDSKKVAAIETNIAPSRALVGTPLVNLFGEVIGMKQLPESMSFVPTTDASAFIDEHK